MRTPMRERFGVWLQHLLPEYGRLERLLLRYDGEGPRYQLRYVNRISRHVVLR